MAQKTLITNGTIVTLGEPLRIIEQGAVLINGNVIEIVGPESAMGVDSEEVDVCIDAGGGLIMPGFINTHMHLYSTFACGISLKDEAPCNFKENLERLWWRLDKALTLDDVRHSALVPLCRGLRAGTTTVIDHHASPTAVRGSLTAIAEASTEVGVRSCLCYELSDRDGPEVARDGIEENMSFIKSCASSRDPMLSAMFGMHASMTIGEETLAAAVDATKEYNIGFHIHTSESVFDPEDSLAKYGKRVVHRLADAGVLGEKTICVHCVHLDDSEIEILRETETNVVHNPQSNMNNAVGAARVLEMMDKGVMVGLGTDAMTVKMLEELRVAMLLQRQVSGDPRVGFMEPVRMLIENNARIASRYFSRPVGALMPGYLADVIVVDYDPPTPMTVDNFAGHLMFGLGTAPVRMAMVDGEIRMMDGEIMGVDEGEIAMRSRELVDKVWERF